MAVIRMRDGAPERSEAVQRLAVALWNLHRQAGRPSTRSLAAGRPISHDTVHRVLRCEAAPRWSTLETVVQGLGGDLETFRALWSGCAESAGEADEVPDQRSAQRERAPSPTSLEPGSGSLRQSSDPWQYRPDTFLAGLAEDVRYGLLALGTTRRLPAGRRLFSEGDLSTHVEVLRTGWVKLTIAPRGVDHLVAIEAPGTLLGLDGLYTEQRHYTVTAVGECVSTVLRAAEMMSFAGRHPGVAATMLGSFARDLQRARLAVVSQSELSVVARLARLLAGLARTTGQSFPEGVQIAVELSQVELAQLIGASENAVQQCLRELRTRGCIRTGYRRISILDLAMLDDIANPW
jgi:CRP/FNR family cyclic AMP-dependent transcriptional regulator